MKRDNRQEESLSPGPRSPAARLLLRQLHDLLMDARRRLADPTVENVDACCRQLGEAVTVCRHVQAGLAGTESRRDAGLRAPLQSLLAEMARVSLLLNSAAAFHTGWARQLGCMVSGYTADGTPGRTEARRRVVLEI